MEAGGQIRGRCNNPSERREWLGPGGKREGGKSGQILEIF